MTDCEVLGVSPRATGEEIHKAYIAKIKEYHPDKFKGDKNEAAKMTKRINAAYSRLKSVIPSSPCPAIAERNKIYTATSRDFITF